MTMANIPTTSTTLLRDLAQDSQHARWGEFVARYRPMMEAFMRERFPSLDADDVIQETLIELIRVFPIYFFSHKILIQYPQHVVRNGLPCASRIEIAPSSIKTRARRGDGWTRKSAGRSRGDTNAPILCGMPLCSGWLRTDQRGCRYRRA